MPSVVLYNPTSILERYFIMIYCIKCKTDKPSSDYYKSTTRANGTGECKSCTRARVTANRAENVEYYREFDKKRANLPHRAKAREDYQKTKRGKEVASKALKKHYLKHPLRSKARYTLSNSIRDGKLFKPDKCETCKNVTALEGHHCDYNKPLDVMWLCVPCHKQWHRENTPIYCNEPKNGEQK